LILRDTVLRREEPISAARGTGAPRDRCVLAGMGLVIGYKYNHYLILRLPLTTWTAHDKTCETEMPKKAGGNSQPPRRPAKPPSRASTSKPPVATSPRVRTVASEALRGERLTPKEVRSLAGSEERHIEPRTRPKGEPISPRTSARVEREGGIGLAKPAKLTPKQRQSLGGSVMAHVEPRRSAKPPTKPSSPRPPAKRGH
jgi:hypothetical protein